MEYFSIIITPDDTAIREFLENDELTILAATTTNDQMLYFQHKVPADANCLLFYKIPQFDMTSNSTKKNNVSGDMVPSVGILTLEGGLVKSIYNTVMRVYSPNVTKVQKKNNHNLVAILFMIFVFVCLCAGKM